MSDPAIVGPQERGYYPEESRWATARFYFPQFRAQAGNRRSIDWTWKVLYELAGNWKLRVNAYYRYPYDMSKVTLNDDLYSDGKITVGKEEREVKL